MRFANKSILSSAATANQTSEVMDLQQIVNLGLILIATGAPTGSFIIEVSNDPVLSGSLVTNWAQLQAPTAVSAAGQTPVSLSNICFRWLRVRYAFTSGTGAVIVNACSHGV